MYTIKNDGPGTLIITDVFSRKTPGFEIDPDEPPKTTRLRAGESATYIPIKGVTQKIHDYPFAP